MMSPPCGKRACVRLTSTVQAPPTVPVLDESKPVVEVVGTPGLSCPGGAAPVNTCRLPPPPVSGVLAGPHVSSVAVGAGHVTGLGGVGGPENGPKTLAEKLNCAALFRAGPLLWIAMVAPVTWLLPKFCSMNCHCRIPVIDWVAVTASRFWGGPDRMFVSCAWRLAPGPPQLGGHAGATPWYSSWTWLFVAVLKLFAGLPAAAALTVKVMAPRLGSWMATLSAVVGLVGGEKLPAVMSTTGLPLAQGSWRAAKVYVVADCALCTARNQAPAPLQEPCPPG